MKNNKSTEEKEEQEFKREVPFSLDADELELIEMGLYLLIDEIHSLLGRILEAEEELGVIDD